jgi:hypothetical protein
MTFTAAVSGQQSGWFESAAVNTLPEVTIACSKTTAPWLGPST